MVQLHELMTRALITGAPFVWTVCASYRLLRRSLSYRGQDAIILHRHRARWQEVICAAVGSSNRSIRGMAGKLDHKELMDFNDLGNFIEEVYLR